MEVEGCVGWCGSVLVGLENGVFGLIWMGMFCDNWFWVDCVYYFVIGVFLLEWVLGVYLVWGFVLIVFEGVCENFVELGVELVVVG